MNNKKEAFLAIFGVVLLILIVVGISYAFFTYSRTGSTNNTVTAGSLYVQFEENNNNLNITDAYPVDDATGVQGGRFTFTVSGYISGNATLNYTVYGVIGNTYGVRTRLRDYEVKMRLSGSIAYGTANSSISVRNNYATTYGNIIGSNGSLTSSDSLVLATGVITSNNSSSHEVHTYNLQLWIPSSVVSIGGTTSTTNGTTTQYTSDDYENLYYSMKINVRVTA